MRTRSAGGTTGGALILALSCSVAAWGCGLSFAEKRTMDAWLNCTDCRDGELGRVERIAAEKPGATTKYLSASLQGPPSDRVANVTQQFAESWARIAAVSPPPLAEPDYIRLHVENYKAGQQLRSARALARIGTSDSREALHDALAADSTTKRFRDDVRAYVTGLVVETGLPAIGVSVHPDAVSYGDTIRIATGAAPGVTTASSVELVGAPFDDPIVIGTSSDSILARVIALPGSYYVSGSDPSTGTEWRSDGPLAVTGVGYEGRSFFRAEDLAPGSVEFAPLSGWLDDRLGQAHAGQPSDHHRVSASNETAMAIVQWSGPGRFELVWLGFGCDSMAFAAGSTVAGNVLTNAGNQIPRARVEIDGGPHALTDEEGWFRLTGLVPGRDVDLLVSVADGPPSVHAVVVGSNELVLVHDGTVAPPPLVARADTASTFLDAGECKTLRVVRTDRLGTAVLTRTEVRLVASEHSVTSPAGSAIDLRAGEARSLPVEVLGDGGVPLAGRRVYWFSSDPSVVSVSADGRATGISPGTATLTVVSGSHRWPITATIHP